MVSSELLITNYAQERQARKNSGGKAKTNASAESVVVLRRADAPAYYDFDPQISNLIAALKTRYIDPYPTGLVHDPSPEGGGHAVSEQVGYYLWTVSEARDASLQDEFEANDAAATTYMLKANGQLAWKVNGTGAVIGFSTATDAEIYRLGAYINAFCLIRLGVWADRDSIDYLAKINELDASVYNNNTWSEGADQYLTPGDWGHDCKVNLSYSIKNIIRQIDRFEAEIEGCTVDNDWGRVITSMEAINALTAGWPYGLTPDWCDLAGQPWEDLSYDCSYDGIRGAENAGRDASLNGDPASIDFCNNGIEFLRDKYGSAYNMANRCRLYSLDAGITGPDDIAEMGVHNPAALGVWASLSMGSDVSDADAIRDAFAAELLAFYHVDGAGLAYLGDYATERNYPFNQFLGLRGMMDMGGRNPDLLREYMLVIENDHDRPDHDRPANIMLQSNYPNPFNGSTTISWRMDQSVQCRLEIFDVNGRLIKIIFSGLQPAGSHQTVWDGTDQFDRPAPSGLYLCRLKTPARQEKINILLVR